MLTPFKFSRERTESRTRSRNAFTAFSLTRLPGGTISMTTGVDASAWRKGRPMQACMGTRRYLNVDNENGGSYRIFGFLAKYREPGGENFISTTTNHALRHFDEPKGGHAKVRQEHHRDHQEVHGIHGRGTSRDEGTRPRAEGVRGPWRTRGQGGRGKRRAREDCRDAGPGSRNGQAAPCDHQSQRASPLAETLVRDARVCQGRQGRLLLPRRAEVQNEVRDTGLQRQGEPRRRHPVAGRLRTERVDPHRGGKDQGAREESGELRTVLCGVPVTRTFSACCGPAIRFFPTKREA